MKRFGQSRTRPSSSNAFIAPGVFMVAPPHPLLRFLLPSIVRPTARSADGLQASAVAPLPLPTVRSARSRSRPAR